MGPGPVKGVALQWPNTGGQAAAEADGHDGGEMLLLGNTKASHSRPCAESSIGEFTQ